jgi:thiosulfate dehydrogenase
MHHHTARRPHWIVARCRLARRGGIASVAFARHAWSRSILLLVGSASVGCAPAGESTSKDSVAVAATAPAAQAPLPAPVAVTRVAFRVPQESEVRDTVVLASVRRGRALLTHTRDSLPRHVGNALVCTNCHQQNGTLADGMPWVGVYARFPQYRSRAGVTNVIEDRVNDCFKRSLNGTPLAPDSRDMRDIVAYMAFLSTGYPVGAETEGQGLPRLAPLVGDTVRGTTIYTMRCARCHGVEGEGTVLAPPVWGSRSYNIGAGMARVRTAATFIKHWMPQDSAGVLSAQESFDVAAYIDSRPRPDFKGKERDWPHGDPPPDVAYETDAARLKRPAAQR